MGTKTETAKIYDLLFKRFVSKRDDNYMLSHIAHVGGFLYASNGHILAKVKMDYPEEREGRTFSETGSSEKSTVNYEGTIPLNREGDIYLPEEKVKDLMAAAKNTWRTKIDGKKVVINIGLPEVYYDYKMCYMTFRAEYLHSAFRLFDIRKEFPKIRISVSKVMALESETITVLIMPVMFPIKEDGNFFYMLTIQEAINFKNQPKNIRDLAWYER
jgi:hypothetical protein